MGAKTARMPRKSKDPTGPVRLKADLAHKLQVICAELKISASDLLDPVVRPFVEGKHREVAKRIAAEAEETRKHK